MPEDPQEVVRRLIALLNARRLSELGEVLASSRHRLVPTGPWAMRRFFHKLQVAFPDCSVTESALIAEEGRVAESEAPHRGGRGRSGSGDPAGHGGVSALRKSDWLPEKLLKNSKASNPKEP